MRRKTQQSKEIRKSCRGQELLFDLGWSGNASLVRWYLSVEGSEDEPMWIGGGRRSGQMEQKVQRSEVGLGVFKEQ